MNRFLENLIPAVFTIGIASVIVMVFFGGFYEEWRRDRSDCTVSHVGDTLVFKANPLWGEKNTVYTCPFQGVADIQGCLTVAKSLGCAKTAGGSAIK